MDVLLDERECVERLARYRWPHGFQCGLCGAKHYYRVQNRPRVFGCMGCGRQQSVTAGTLLHRTRVPLGVWFLAVELMDREEGVSAAELQRRTGVHYETAWQILHRLRAGLEDPMLNGALRAAHSGVRCKPPSERSFRPIFGWIVVISDPRGFHIVTDVPPKRINRLPQLQHTMPVRTGIVSMREPFEKAWAARQRLRHTHYGVSAAWLGRYLREIGAQYTRNGFGLDAERQVLGAALRAEARRFELLCPTIERLGRGGQPRYRPARRRLPPEDDVIAWRW